MLDSLRRLYSFFSDFLQLILIRFDSRDKAEAELPVFSRLASTKDDSVLRLVRYFYGCSVGDLLNKIYAEGGDLLFGREIEGVQNEGGVSYIVNVTVGVDIGVAAFGDIFIAVGRESRGDAREGIFHGALG